MHYPDYLRTTVLLLAIVATALTVITVGTVVIDANNTLAIFSVSWWAVCFAVGLYIGRGAGPLESIRAMMSRSRPEPIFPRLEPATIMMNRHWPILLTCLVCGGLAAIAAQPAAAATGYAIIWALAWRKQSAAVEAIEERDGVRFYVVKTGLASRMKVVRMRGFAP